MLLISEQSLFPESGMLISEDFKAYWVDYTKYGQQCKSYSVTLR